MDCLQQTAPLNSRVAVVDHQLSSPDVDGLAHAEVVGVVDLTFGRKQASRLPCFFFDQFVISLVHCYKPSVFTVHSVDVHKSLAMADTRKK